MSRRTENGLISDLVFSADGSTLLATTGEESNSELLLLDGTPLDIHTQVHDVISRLFDQQRIGRLNRSQLLARLDQDATLPAELRQAVLKHLDSTLLDSDELNERAWLAVRESGKSIQAYTKALEDAAKAVAIAPANGNILNTLGLAQYRCEHYSDAKQTLLRAYEANDDSVRAGDLAVLAMVCQQLNLHQEAKDYLSKARVFATPTVLNRQPDIRSLIQEAEAILEPKSVAPKS